MEDLKFLIQTQNLFQNLADIVGELIKTKEKETNGEDVKEEIEMLFNRFMLESMELEAMK